MLLGQFMAGCCVSLTVIVNEQLSESWPLSQLTVVVPVGKNTPDAGEHVSVPQVPLVAGSG